MMAGLDRVCLEDLADYFEGLDDPRSAVNRRYPLVSVVVIALMAVLAGAGGPTAIAAWAREKEAFLIEALSLPDGVPRKDVFRRVLMSLNPSAFQACFTAWLLSLRQRAEAASEVTQPVLAVDGKTSRRSHDRKNGLGALHSVSVWAAEFGLSLGQVATDDKSNEITAIPELLRLVDIKGSIITIDALGTQKQIARQIVEQEADYVLALKKNHKQLHQAVVSHIAEHLQNDQPSTKAREHTTSETGHGREETRTYIQMPAPQDLPGFRHWTGLKTIGIVILTCLRNGHETTNTRYYISSLSLGVKRFARAVRTHWSIENTLHWRLDVTYREDDSRPRNEHLRENQAWINRFTLSLLKQHKSKDSLAMKRRRCAWNEEFLTEVLTTTTT
ncbi:MAG: ISAs1 family transposase [Rubripirellula sp.]|nr:ISAs1 family transposase [Rubripirellula sp.]